MRTDKQRFQPGNTIRVKIADPFSQFYNQTYRARVDKVTPSPKYGHGTTWMYWVTFIEPSPLGYDKENHPPFGGNNFAQDHYKRFRLLRDKKPGEIFTESSQVAHEKHTAEK